MTTSALALAALATLLAGQSATDQAAYAIYQAKLAALMRGTQASSSAGESSAPAPAAASSTAPAGCLLSPGSGNLARTSDCTACHVTYAASHSHPVDVPQDAGRSRSLRPAAEVVRRGVFLADGMVTCLSCHDGNSTWKYKLALPPDASARPRVKPRDANTYAFPVALASATVQPGADVSPTPLCKACHGFE